MNIRPANLIDVERCQEIDASYETDHVWRMEERVGGERIDVTFQRMRTPRRMQVPYPRNVEGLQDDWQRQECFLVAHELGRIAGYLDMTVHPWRWRAQMEHVVVRRPYRRQGVATLLLNAAEHWARGSRLRAVSAVIQSKNDPAIALFEGRGYRFQGFIDEYYENGDIGLMFTLSL